VFAELLRCEGVEEVLELRSRFGLMAFHGGSLEQGTDIVAEAVAAQAGASLYAVRQPPDLRWHIPSIQCTPEQSPAMAAFLDHVDAVVAVHGFGRRALWRSLLLGGRDRCLAAHLGIHLRSALEGYDVVEDLDLIPAGLRGLHPDNPVNRAGESGGVQLELPPPVRDGPDAVALVDAMVTATTIWAGVPT
jgi:phage replication-related protein YjqB (UPF0714/DUF867 family)